MHRSHIVNTVVPLRAVLLRCLLGLVALCSPLAHAQNGRVSQQEIEDTYRAKKQGEHLYRAGKYKEAVPFLEFAAQRGFKQAQAQLGSIYVNGLGDIEQDVAQGVGWLGVAASGKSDARIKGLFDDVWKSLPKAHQETLQGVIDKFKEMYDGRRTRVSCELDQRAGTNTRVLRCKFQDEGQYPHLDVEV